MTTQQPLRWGMVGGGIGAFIGEVHRLAVGLDGVYQLVAGAFSSTAEKTLESARQLGVDPDRAYASFQAMAEAEARREDGIQVVSIVTPNHLHFEAAKAFLQAGIHVICDKPLTTTLAEAQELAQIAHQSGCTLAVTYNYTGNALIRQAQAMVAAGELGRIRLVQVEYAQDWLSEAIERDGVKQASWRTDPKRAGRAGCLGDIGVHAYNLARFVSGLELESVCADLTSFVPGRPVDDNVQASLRFKGGAKGALWASQVAVGAENALVLRVYGDKASLEWSQENPNELKFSPYQQPSQTLTRAGSRYPSELAYLCRTPAGHPEGYLEAFANIYKEIAAELNGTDGQFPRVEDSLADMAFIEACLNSHDQGSSWITL